VIVADAEAHCLVFVITLLPPHCFLCMGIVCLVLVYFLFFLNRLSCLLGEGDACSCSSAAGLASV
jgi:hypothetical protein